MSRPLRELPEALSVASRLYVQATASALDTMLRTAEDHAYRNLSGRVLNNRSGRLRGSLRSDVSIRGTEVTGKLTAGGRGVRHARIHEEGGVIHGRPWLTFRVPGGGWRRVHQVRIPKRPYLEPALVDAQRDLGEELTANLMPLLSLEALT